MRPIRQGLFRQPILTSQAINTGKFAQVTRDEFQAQAARMARDKQVVGAD
jgi:hypothetical protein